MNKVIVLGLAVPILNEILEYDELSDTSLANVVQVGVDLYSVEKLLGTPSNSIQQATQNVKEAIRKYKIMEAAGSLLFDKKFKNASNKVIMHNVFNHPLLILRSMLGGNEFDKVLNLAIKLNKGNELLANMRISDLCASFIRLDNNEVLSILRMFTEVTEVFDFVLECQTKDTIQLWYNIAKQDVNIDYLIRI